SAVRTVAMGKAGRWDVLGPLRRLRRLIVLERADVVYAFLPMQTVLAALLAPGRVVFGLRAGGMDLARYDRLSALSYRAEAYLSRRAAAIIANARAVRAQVGLQGIAAGSIAVIANGIDTDAFRPDPVGRAALRAAWRIPEGALAIGMVARIDPMKDHGNFLRAAAAFLAVHPAARFVCVGDGAAAYRRALVQQADALELGGAVIWAGERHDLAAIYSALDIATLSSAFGEGFSNVLGEAMACGTPVVATDVGDAAAIVGDAGLVVRAGDPGALAEGWRSVAARDRAALSAAARARIVTQFSVARMVERTERALELAIRGESPEAIAREIDRC
ncbi:MAG: glycosyltransferase, partial [Rhodospirillales bacterium]|nr:glycosyltransferase [Rhodospirillales bacterium]